MRVNMKDEKLVKMSNPTLKRKQTILWATMINPTFCFSNQIRTAIGTILTPLILTTHSYYYYLRPDFST